MTKAIMKYDSGTDKHHHVATYNAPNHAVDHLDAASFFLGCYSDKEGDTRAERHYSMSSIIHSAFFIEALINEIIFDLKENSKKLYLSHGEETKWNKYFTKINGIDEMDRTLNKYQTVFEAMNDKILDYSESPYNEIRLIVMIRNYFAHPKPDEIVTHKTKHLPQKDLHSLEKALKGVVRLKNKNQTFLGQGLYSRECAQWVLNCTINFYLQYCKDIKRKPYDIEHYRL